MKEKYPSNHPMTQRLRRCQITTQHWWKTCAKDSPLYLLGVVLQPHLRTNFLSQWANTYGEELVASAKDKMYTFWEEYQQAMVVETPQPPPPRPLSERAPSLDLCQNMSILTSKLNALAFQPVRPSDEFRAYLDANLEFELAKLERMQKEEYEKSKKSKQSTNLPSNNLPKIPTIIQWWYQQRQTWPTLTKFAIEILSIAAMSDDVEQAFSGARRTISWERARIGIDKVEAVECLGSWLPCKLEAMIERLEGILTEETEDVGGDEVSERVVINVQDDDTDEGGDTDEED